MPSPTSRTISSGVYMVAMRSARSGSYTLSLDPSHDNAEPYSGEAQDHEAEPYKRRRTTNCQLVREDNQTREVGKQRSPDPAVPLDPTVRQGCNESHSSCQVPRESSYAG